ncbi:MAG: dynamin family protein [Clostridium sp.]|nr:dynamin family protein [Clostridium sp.]
MGMMDSINAFVDTMIAEQSNFENIQNEISRREDDVLAVLKDLEIKENEIITQLKNGIAKTEDENMQEIFDKSSESLYLSMSEANKKIEQAVKGMTFINDFEKRFTVSVFGKVKAGKSYIGNLIMGQPVRKAGLASSYDKLSDLTVHVYDRGKMYEQNKLSTAIEEKECNGEEFYVDKNEATSTIQWVNIGGMCWFDTPGIGSVTVENEELAKEYVKNSDLVIFACNSDAAGTRQEFFEIRQLYDMGKPILLLLTQSDAYDYDVDDEGEEISVLVPKSDKDRQDQENYMIETLREQGMEDVLKYADILTVSALLATEALANNNEEMFEQSNIGKLLDKLTSITKNDAADMKRNTPKSRINEMIDSIICDLNTVSNEVAKYCEGIEDSKRSLSERKDWMVEQIRAALNIKILEIIGQAKAEVESSGSSVSEEELSNRINQAIIDIVQKVCIEEAISNSESIPDINIKLTGIGDMKMRRDSIPYEHISVRQVHRDPSGIFEKIGHFLFNKEYYTSEEHTVTKYSTFDIGVNDNEIAQNIILQLETIFSGTVEKYIEYLTRGYYEPIEILQRKTTNEIEETIIKLKGMRM